MTADGRRLMVVAVTSSQWAALVTGIGVAEEVRDLEDRLGFPLDSDSGRYAARTAIAEVVEHALSAMPSSEAAERLERAGACWSWYRTFEEVAREEVAAANPMLRSLAQQGIGSYYATSSPVRVDGSTLHAGEAPMLGQHSEEVISEILGTSERVLGKLVADGLIGRTGPQTAK